MSLYLTSTTLMPPSLPSWLEETCQRLGDNDPSLTTLELSRSRIDDVFARVVAGALQENDTVTAVILSCFSIVDDGAYALGAVLGASKKIQRLQLRDLRNSREVITFFQLLLQNTSLEEISLRHSKLCPNSAVYLSRFLSLHPRLKEVRLVDCQLEENSLQVICQGLQSNKTLQRLYLINTELQDSHAVHLSDMLQQGAQCLRELHLCENNLGDAGVAVLASGLLKNQSVRHLDLRSNGITAQGCLSLQGLIVSSDYLRSLNVANNEVGSLGVAALTRGLLRPGCVLQKLDLNANGINHVGARALANVLMRAANSSAHQLNLQELNLAFNSVGDKGAAELAKALVRNKTLTRLCLRRNGISDTGADSIARSLPKMTGLKELFVNKNRITQKGASALLQGLRSNVGLQHLHVEDKVSEPITKEIFHWIKLNKGGRQLFRHSNVPAALWPRVISRSSSDSNVLFYFLNEKPDLFVSLLEKHSF